MKSGDKRFFLEATELFSILTTKTGTCKAITTVEKFVGILFDIRTIRVRYNPIIVHFDMGAEGDYLGVRKVT